MSDQPPRIERHEAADRFGKISLRTAHDITTALVEAGVATEDEPVVVRTNGPHRSIGELAALIDEALAEEPSGSENPPPVAPS